MKRGRPSSRPPEGADQIFARLAGAARAVAAQTDFQPLVAFLCASGAAVFAFLVAFVLDDDSDAVDRALLLALRRPDNPAIPIGPPWMLQSAIDVSALGGFTVIWLLTLSAAGFLALARRWRALFILVCAIGGASLLNSALKSGFHRARPDVVPHLAESWSASFPSGHAMISAAAYLTVAAILAQTQRSHALRECAPSDDMLRRRVGR